VSQTLCFYNDDDDDDVEEGRIVLEFVLLCGFYIDILMSVMNCMSLIFCGFCLFVSQS
jgi:hypothetical protein